MSDKKLLSTIATSVIAASLFAAAPAVLAETQSDGGGSGYQMGPGMMGGGYGPGMMGGYGMGPGMMGGYGGPGMGPGMMGGCGGGGPGMMGGYGMGPGMMGGYWAGALGLSDEQQSKINKIQDETRKKHWLLMGTMMDEQAKLRDLYEAPKRDQAAIDEAYKSFEKLRQQMYDSSVDAQKRTDAVLTKEQREKMEGWWRGPGPRR